MLNLQNLISVAVVTGCCILYQLSGAPATEALASDNRAAGNHCPAFNTISRYRVPGNSITANPDNWISRLENAEPGDEILLEDGTYRYEGYAIVIEKPLTIRGKSGDPDKVIIQGRGYGDPAEGLMVQADDVHIADLTIQDIHHHAISLQEGFGSTVIYNVSLLDIGTQHIKGNRMGPDGLIACSKIGYQSPTGAGDYNSGIDLHGAVRWHIRDNHIYNIFGDGSGCVVDTECGSQPAGGGAAILVWQDSIDNTIERNVITESFRGILLGLNSPYSGGVVRNNFIQRQLSGKEGVNGFIEADTGISLIGADNVVVEGNTVMLAGDYPGVIEVWKATGITVRNNLISKPVWNRGDADYNGCASQSAQDCDQSDFSNAVIANHIQPANNPAIATTSVSSEQSMESTAKEPATENAQKLVTDNNISSGNLSPESLKEYESLLLQFRQERILMMSERLKMKEERLQLINDELNRR